MFESLLKNVKPSQLLGIRVATVGLLMTGAGFATVLLNVHFFGSLRAITILGAAMIYLGMAVGFVGVVIHFYIMCKMFVGRK
jgi:hypothetical protein